MSQTPLGNWTGSRARILFGLAWLHAVVQERRTYIPQVSKYFLED
jgi:hypothetical protein